MDFQLTDFQLVDFQLMDYIVDGLQLLIDFQLMDFQLMDYLLTNFIVDKFLVDRFDWVNIDGDEVFQFFRLFCFVYYLYWPVPININDDEVNCLL